VDKIRHASRLFRHHRRVSVIEILQRRGGTATFAELRTSVSGRAIRLALADGMIRRITKGWVVDVIRKAIAGSPGHHNSCESGVARAGQRSLGQL